MSLPQRSIVKSPDPQIMKDAENISAFVSRAMNSDFLKNLLTDCYRVNKDIYNNAGGIVINYAIATRDFSDSAIEKIFSEIQKSGKVSTSYSSSSGNYDYLSYGISSSMVVSSLIADFYLQETDISKITSDMSKLNEVLKTVEHNCKDNGFFTHSFNGALIPAIDEKGLDISQEMFAEEYKKFAWDDTMWAKGELCLTPSSNMTFQYTTGSPERLLCGPLNLGNAEMHTRKDGETTEEFYKRRLEAKLSWSNYKLGQHPSTNERVPGKIKTPIEVFGEDGVEDMRQAGHRLIDFYATPKDAGIAIIPKQIFDDKNNNKTEPDMYESIVMEINYGYGKDVDALGLSPELLEVLKNYKRSDKLNAQILYGKILAEICKNGKITELDEFTHRTFLNSIGQCTDISDGSGFGIAVDGGKVPRDFFTIASVPEIDSMTAEIQVKPFLSNDVKDELKTLRANYKQANIQSLITALDDIMTKLSRVWSRDSDIDVGSVNSKELHQAKNTLKSDLRGIQELLKNNGASKGELKAIDLIIGEIGDVQIKAEYGGTSGIPQYTIANKDKEV